MEALAAFFIVLAFALGFFIGRVSTRPQASKRIAVNEDEDVLFDRLEALRRTRFAPPMKTEIPRVSPQLAARLKQPTKKEK